jgi:hypothetical protein
MPGRSAGAAATFYPTVFEDQAKPHRNTKITEDTMAHAYYAIGLNFHQPCGNLVDLHNTTPWEARQVLHACARAVRWDNAENGVLAEIKNGRC